MKTCTKCHKEYPATAEFFCRDKRNKSGLEAQCKECNNEYQRKYRQTDKAIAAQRGYQQSEKRTAAKRKYDSSEKGIAKRHKYDSSAKRRRVTRNRQLKRKYGITPSQHLLMYADQNGCCAICGQAVPYSDVHTDHDHKTGEVRGLLCSRCNWGLGNFLDNPDSLRKAADYLEEGL